MFDRFIEQITTAFTEYGLSGFKSEREIVAFVLAQLATMVQSEPEAILTLGELAQIQKTYEGFIQATGEREQNTIRCLLDALGRTRVLKAFSGQADLKQQTSDELWRETDLLQADLEIALDAIDPDQLRGWLDSRW